MKVVSSIIFSFTFLFCLQINQVWGKLIKNPSYDEAPRPALIPEEVITLDQEKWEFAIGDSQKGSKGTLRHAPFSQEIIFGYAPESELSGIDYESLRPSGSQDIVWYKKTLKIPADWKGAILTLEGVDYETEIFVNEKFVSSHRGAYAPIEIDITPFMNPDSETTIYLRAQDDRSARNRAVGKQERRPFEGVIFYGNSTGAWKGAHLRKINPDYYVRGFVHHTNANGVFSYKVDIAGAKASEVTAEVKLVERGSKKIAGIPSKSFFAEFKIDHPKLWTPENPYLYDVEINLLRNGEVVERLRSYAGFSTFSQTNGHFFLNGKPYYLRGVLNQMVFPKGLYTPDTSNSNAQDIVMMKTHGFNFQRVHQTTPRWKDIYEMDKIGIGWSLEMPSARDLRNPGDLEQFKKEWKEVISAYGFGHPGLFYFVSGNEDWGMLEDPDHWSPASDSEREKFQLSLLKATLEVAPPGSLVSPGDGWRQITGMKNGNVLPDINPEQIILSAHDYRGSGKELIDAYGSIPVNTPVGTQFPRNGKELILSGFDFPGNFVAPMLGELGGKSYAPPGIGNVFGYGNIYREIEDWTRDAITQLESVGELPIMRGGYVYTQLRDAGFKPHIPLPADRPAGELNGFLTADGIPKSDPSIWRNINFQNQSNFEKNYLLYQSMSH